jgi:hypothetical protein
MKRNVDEDGGGDNDDYEGDDEASTIQAIAAMDSLANSPLQIP